MSDAWTIARVLDWTLRDFAARGIAPPRLEAELLIAHVLGMARVQLYARHDQPLLPEELASIRALVERRRRHEPMAYILGRREFYGRSFEVNQHVLVPRPETEDVVEFALGHIAPGTPVRVLDLCTGSAAIAATLASERSEIRVDAVEISENAAAVARRNVAALGVGARVTVHVGSLYAPVRGQRYRLIVANPPYIASRDIAGLMADVRDHEPRLALDGGESGLAVIGPLVLGAPDCLEDDGVVVMEIGADQRDAVLDLAARAGLTESVVRRDRAGRDRVLVARRQASVMVPPVA